MAQPARTGLLRSIRHHNREASFLGIEQATISNPHRLRLAMRENDGSRRLQPTTAVIKSLRDWKKPKCAWR